MADGTIFNKFRRRARRDVWIKSSILGVAAAAFCVGGVLLAAKLAGFSELYCCAGLIALPAVWGIAYAVLRQSDRRLARRMDRELDLRERVQTMVAFSESEEDMVRIQREDTQRRLAELPTRRLRFTGLAAYILLPVLAAALCIGAVICPSGAAEPAPDPDVVETVPPRDITEWEWQALDELIEYVRTSEADETVMKPGVITALEDLRALLLRGVTEESLPMFVSVTVTEVNNLEVEANQRLDSAGLSEEVATHQKERNTEVARYTVSKLCEIFRVDMPSQPDSPDEQEPETSDGEQSWIGSGEISMGANDRMFDADLGYVAYKTVINEYYAEISKAFHEGALSEDEWYEYLMTYFGYLYGKE